MAFEQPLPKSLSPSRLSDFQSCPRKYQYTSVERISQPATYATAKGNVIHYIFEQLFLLEPQQRTIDAARSFVASAEDVVLTETVKTDIGLNDTLLNKLRNETADIITRYFQMEDPTKVAHEGVELALGVDVAGAPLYGILDRLDRDEDGSLVIVDYKTGKLPNRNYDTSTFANAELYAALCEAKLGERPTKIRLLYVSHGQAIERNVTDVVSKARGNAAATAWNKITRYYNDGDFPATPSPNSCRFCSFKDRCRSEGVPVPA
jgi:putative RecB family exonuclease